MRLYLCSLLILSCVSATAFYGVGRVNKTTSDETAEIEPMTEGEFADLKFQLIGDRLDELEARIEKLEPPKVKLGPSGKPICPCSSGGQCICGPDCDCNVMDWRDTGP